MEVRKRKEKTKNTLSLSLFLFLSISHSVSVSLLCLHFPSRCSHSGPSQATEFRGTKQFYTYKSLFFAFFSFFRTRDSKILSHASLVHSFVSFLFLGFALSLCGRSMLLVDLIFSFVLAILSSLALDSVLYFSRIVLFGDLNLVQRLIRFGFWFLLLVLQSGSVFEENWR